MEISTDINSNNNISSSESTNVIQNNLSLDINGDSKNKSKNKSIPIPKPNPIKRSHDIITYNYFKSDIAEYLDESSKLKSKKKKPFMYRSQLTKTLESLKIKYPKLAKKQLLEDLLFSVYKFILKCDNIKDLSKIISIQKKLK